ncbi:Nanos-like protein 1, partial [Gryllus bimaculatus]
MAVCSSRMLKWFPFNPSLSEEMERLFAPASDSYDDIMEEFRANGQDSEYCPDSEEELPGTLRGPGSRQRRGKGLGLVLAGGGFMGRALPPPPPPPASPPDGPGPQPATTAASPIANPAIANPAAARPAAAAFALGLLPPPGTGLHCAFCRNNGETVDSTRATSSRTPRSRAVPDSTRVHVPQLAAPTATGPHAQVLPHGRPAVAAALECRPRPCSRRRPPLSPPRVRAPAAGAAKALQAAMAATPSGPLSKALASASAVGAAAARSR